MKVTMRLFVAIVQLRGTSVVAVRPQQALGLVVVVPGLRRPPTVPFRHRFPFQLPRSTKRLRHRPHHRYLLARRRVPNNNTLKCLSHPSMARHQLEDMLMLNITGIMDPVVMLEVRLTLACTAGTWACRLQTLTRTLVAPIRAVNH